MTIWCRQTRSEKPRGSKVKTKKWQVLARRTAYESEWVSVRQLDLELPDGSIARNYHLIDYPRSAASVVPVDDRGNVLMIDHYRFQTGTRGWEIPAGKIDRGETPAQAARREMIEETGYAVGTLKKLGRYHPSNGSSNQVFYVFVGRVKSKVGAIQDTNEVSAVRWFGEDEVRELIAQNKIRDGLSLTSLLWYFASRLPIDTTNERC